MQDPAYGLRTIDVLGSPQDPNAILSVFSALPCIPHLEVSEREKEVREVYAMAINVRTLLITAAVAMLLALGGAGIAYANGGGSEEQLTGPDAEKAKSAAIAAVGGGTVTEVERDDANGTGAFEVEVTREDGSQLEVHLDGELNVVGQEADEDGPNDQDGPNDD